MRARAVLLGLVVLLPAALALLPAAEAQNPFTTSLSLSAAAPSRALPFGGTPVPVPVEILVRCTAIRSGPVALEVAGAPAWLGAAFGNESVPVPSDPRDCSPDGFYHLRDVVYVKALSGAKGGARGELKLLARHGGDSASATVPLKVEAAAKLAFAATPPSFKLDPATRQTVAVLTVTNAGNVPLEVRVEPSPPPSVTVDPPKLLKSLEPGASWSAPLTITASPSREDPFTLRIAVKGAAVGGKGPETSETVVWYFVPPVPEEPEAPIPDPTVQNPIEVHGEETEPPAPEGGGKDVPAPGLALLLAVAGVAAVARRRFTR